MARSSAVAALVVAALVAVSAAEGRAQSTDTPPPMFTTDPAVVSEPDDTAAQATAIAPSIVYQAAIDKPYDVDWFKVTVLAGRYALVEMVTNLGAAGCSESLHAESDKGQVTYFSDHVGVLRVEGDLSNTENTFSMTGGCQGLVYQLRVTPADAIVLPAPPVSTRTASLSLFRAGTTYRGRIRSSDGVCRSGRRVELRKRGRGGHVFARATTGADGAFRVVRGRRLGGRLYAVAPAARDGQQACGQLRSAAIRG